MKDQSHTSPLAVVILAAGAGSRMRSALPKPLHRVAGRSLLGHVLDASARIGAARTAVVVGHGGDAVAAEALRLAPEAAIARQETQEGTGHAVRCALPALDGFEGDVLVLYADTPFILPETLLAMRDRLAAGAGVAALGFEAAEPGGYGRLICAESGDLDRIVEAADATEQERAVRFCNSGVIGFAAGSGRKWLGALRNDNAKGEYYLTDLVALARAEGRRCAAVTCAEAETLGVNSRADLAAAEAAFQQRARRAAMAAGATLTAPETVFFSYDTVLGRDVDIGPFVVFGPGARVADGARIAPFSHIEGAEVAQDAQIGPYARLRPGAQIGEAARVGNFVEIKNASLGPGAKANHLSYLGDAAIGAGANIGAGTITCNYDGYLKHRTEIGAGAFIGSNSALVAPVTIGAGAYVGSGSVVTEDAPEDSLAIARARQVVKPGLAARLRARLSAKKRQLRG